MNKLIKSFMAAALLFGAGSLIESHPARAQATVSSGSLRGVIRDKGANNEPAIGATVVATSPALQGQQVVITDDSGQYFITSLPNGVYTLTVYYNDGTYSRGNILVQVGKEAVINVDVNSAAAKGKGETIVIHGTAPIVDQGSTKTGVTITDDYTRNIPTGRTFGAVVGSAAGSQGDNYGISIAGATSAENTYIVEGIDTTDTGFGGISSNLPNEFISETEVITGGYNAEYGRATGGIVNVVTKQGSNQFHGSVWGYYQPGGLVAPAKVIQREGGSIDAKTDLDYRYDVGAEVGGPIIKDKLWFHVGFNPSITHNTLTRLVQTQVDKNGDGVPDTDSVTGFSLHDPVSSSELPEDFKTYFFTAKINGAINQNHQFQISAFGNPRVAQDVFGVTRNPQQDLWKYNDGAEDISGKWTSKFNGGKTEVDAVLGYHHGYVTENPYSADENVPLIFYNYNRSLYDFADLEGASTIAKCQDGGANDPYPMIQNCPVNRYADQGMGYLEQRVNDRTSANLSITQRVKALGYHVFKAGVDAQFSTYNSTRFFTGGQELERFANTAAGAPGFFEQFSYLKRVRNLTDAEVADPSTVTLGPNQKICAGGRAICETTDQLHADTNDQSYGAFIQDSWQIRPNLTINLGLRYEQQLADTAKALQGTVTPDGEVVPKVAVKLDNLWAPRLGFIYDPTQEGRSKIFGHWGRFYEDMPMDINVRAFGGEVENINLINFGRTPVGGQGYDPNCNVDHGTANPVGTIGMCSDVIPRAILGEGTEYVTPGISGQYTDEFILGTEYEVLPDLKLGLNYVHRSLPSVIEDISTDGGNTYFITNPGKNFDGQAATLEKQAMQLMASSDPKDQALGELYDYRAKQMEYIKTFDKPVRNYDALQLTLQNRPTKQALIMASYTYSLEKGNYPGLFSTETGQLDPNLTSLYDLPDLMANRYGFMGLDRPHNLKIDGFYQFDLKKAGLLTTGASFRAQSGIAHNALAAHPTYGSGESYLLPRGAEPRSPVTSELDIHVSYGRRLNKTTQIEAFADIFNLFDQQDQLNVDENYTFDNAVPVVGGTPDDLAHIKAHDQNGYETNQSLTPNPNFLHTGASNGLISAVQQAPRTIRFGVRLTF